MTTRAHRYDVTRVALGVLLVALVAGCGGSRDEGPADGVAADPGGGTPTSEPTRSERRPGPVGKAAGVPTRLGAGDPRPRMVCASDERGLGTIDYVAGAKGDPTPEEAIEAYVADGESFVMTEDGRTAWVLRPDGTAHTRLGLVRVTGWLVETTETCAGGS
jgi:hypothetical protein